MSQQTGRVTIVLDGEQLRSQPGASLQIGGIQRTGDVTDQGEFYYQEKGVPAQIKCSMPHMADTDLVKLRSWRGTAQFRCDSGAEFTVSKAVTAEVGDLADGKVDVTIMGSPVK